ncbi:hypothetical protein [Anabaena azotica]|uniref:Uncharacterized protein n=1 Tax=Anabaena azotica FACHB-119 TaxID=947527 RepID=A0ABR8CZQ5_9NOST|nr:hypothetical protein [Anabaena azotica]MBD2500373.1 hypothetical protein [Anabaena azotica FACHB-119]
MLEQQRVEATNISNEFFAAAALRMQTITQLGEGISATIQGAAENAKASVMATVQQQKATVTAQIAQQRDQAESEAQGIIAQIQAQYQVALATTSQTTATGRQKVETEYTTSLQKLAESENNQLARMEEFYAQAGEKYRAAGKNVGNEAIALGEQKASAWESQIKNEDDSFLDGPLTDNRLKAKAKAAREVAEQYKKGLIQEAKKQADAVGQGKAKDIAAIHNVANQSRQQLQTLQQQSLDNLNAVEQQVLSQLGQAQTQLTQTANQTRQTTLQTLNQQQAAQMQLLDAYGQRQVLAIDRDAQKAIASIQAGINQATTNLQTVLQDTQNQLQGMPAPPPEELSAALADILAQFDDAVAQVQNQTEQGIAASEQGIIGGGQQVVTGVRAIAQTGLQESAAVAEQAKTTLTNLHQGAVNTFSQIQQAFTTTINKTSETAVTGFAQTTQGVDTAFNQVNQNLDSNFQKATNDLEAGLRGALQGAKQPNLESDIEKYAQEAADQEQPRWKTVVKVLLVIAVIVVAIVVAPAVIGAVGAVAGALGASAAAAGTIGAVVGGAIVGAVAGAVIQVGNNAIDGKNLLDGVGKAALVGAIGGAGGALGNALGQAGKLGAGVTQSVLKFGIDVAFDIAGSIAGDLAVGNPITVEGILIGAAIGAAVQISTANLGKLGKFGRNVEAMQTRTFQAGEQFGTSLGGKVKGAFGGVDAPKVGSPDAGVGGVKAPETGLPKGDQPEVDAHGSTKSDMDMPSVKQPDFEVKPETNIPSGRSTHLDEPEIEPGVVAKRPTTDGHEIKVLKDGRVVRCSDCAEIRQKYVNILEQNPSFQERLNDIEQKISDADQKAIQAEQLEQMLKLLPDNPSHSFVFNENILKVNNQIDIHPTKLKELERSGKLQELLTATKELNDVNGDLTKVSQNNQTIIKQLSSSSGQRLRFDYQLNSQVDEYLTSMGIKDKPLFQNMSNSDRKRLFDLPNSANPPKDKVKLEMYEILNQQSVSYALGQSPKTVSEFVNHVEFYKAHINRKQKALIEGYTNKFNQQVEAEKLQFNKLTPKQKEDIHKKVSQEVFGQELTGQKQVDKAIQQQILKDAGITNEPGKVNKSIIQEAQQAYQERAQYLENRLGSNEIDPKLSASEMSDKFRELDTVKFSSESTAVYHAYKHYEELPPSHRMGGNEMENYLNSASKTIKNSPEPLTSLDQDGNQILIYRGSYTEGNVTYKLKAIVKVSPDGKVNLATYFQDTSK